MSLAQTVRTVYPWAFSVGVARDAEERMRGNVRIRPEESTARIRGVGVVREGARQRHGWLLTAPVTQVGSLRGRHSFGGRRVDVPGRHRAVGRAEFSVRTEATAFDRFRSERATKGVPRSVHPAAALPLFGMIRAPRRRDLHPGVCRGRGRGDAGAAALREERRPGGNAMMHRTGKGGDKPLQPL